MRGFTLTELMTTVALMSVLVGLAVPSFRNMMAGNRLVTQSNEFIGAINFARSEAITRNSTVTFCRADSETDTECATADGNWAAWIVLNSDGDVMRHGPINGLVLVNSDLPDQTVVFSADGLARSGGGLVTDSVIAVCVTREINDNFRFVTIGAGSRLSTTKDSGDCE